jgi:hypothetical protein
MKTLAPLNPYERLAPSPVAATPFRYFLTDACLAPEIEAALLEWLEQAAPWQLVETDFYEQFEFDMRDADLPSGIASLVAPASLEALRGKMEATFGNALSSYVQVVAHRLDPGQRIAIHNDMRDGGETHRLTVQLNRGLADEDGGFFMLFNSDDASDIHRILRPVSGSAIGFAISGASHHAVSRLHGGERFTLVYSFYGRDDGKS